MFPAILCDATPALTFSESPVIGDEAKGVEGDGTTNGELVDLRGVPDLERDAKIFCWSI